MRKELMQQVRRKRLVRDGVWKLETNVWKSVQPGPPEKCYHPTENDYNFKMLINSATHFVNNFFTEKSFRVH